MASTEHDRTALFGTRYFGPARAVKLDEDSGEVLVRLTAHPKERDVWARPAFPEPGTIHPGDELLVAGEEMENLFVIGRLGTARATPRRIELGRGAYAEVAGTAEDAKLQVFSPRRELLFEYDPEAERARLRVESGDLYVETARGDIGFRASGRIRLEGSDVEVSGRDAFRLAAPESQWIAQRAQFQVRETRYAGESLLATVRDVKAVTRKLETVSDLVLEKARNVYRSARELTQLRTGRLQTMVAATFHLTSRRTLLKADEDYKIKAERIHLG